MNYIEYTDKIARLVRRLSMYRCRRRGNIIWWGGKDNAVIEVTETKDKQSVDVKIQKRLKATDALGHPTLACARHTVSKVELYNLRIDPAVVVWPMFEHFEENYMIDLDASPSTVVGIHALKRYRTEHPHPARSGWHLQPVTQDEIIRIIKANPHMQARDD